MEITKNKKSTDMNYSMFIKLALIILIPAVVGAVIGNFIDTNFNVKPWGTLATLIIFNILTWVIILRATSFIIGKAKDKK